MYSDAVTIANIISGTGGLVQAGTGTLILTFSANTWTGTTTISNGTLQIGNGGTTGLTHRFRCHHGQCQPDLQPLRYR